MKWLKIKSYNLWLKNVHQFSQKRWAELFTALAQNKNIDDLDFEQVPMSGPALYK